MVKQPNHKEITNKDIWSSLELEAEQLYKYVLTIASAFSGGTWFFLDKITETPLLHSLNWLFWGWAFLLSSIVTLPVVRLVNLASGKSVLEDNIYKARILDKRNYWLTVFMILFLVLGLSFISIFVGINLIYKAS